jgi:uncharacterized phage protein (TIGR02218 family)
MRTMSTALLNFVNSANEMIMVDLFTFELKNGVTLRYCTHSDAVTFGGATWQPAPAGLTRSRIRWATGIEVDTLDIVMAADLSITVLGTPLLAAAVKGLFDNCRVTYARLFLSDWATPIDTLVLFQGNSAPAEVMRSSLRMTIKSDLERLNVPFPPNVFQASCMHALFDIGCAVNSATYRVAGSVTAVNADGSIQTALAQASGYFQMGAIKFTSGANVGLTRTVKAFIGSAVYLSNPFPFVLAAADAFLITPGCDKLVAGDCTNKYSNVIRFKATPFIPVPETAA